MTTRDFGDADSCCMALIFHAAGRQNEHQDTREGRESELKNFDDFWFGVTSGSGFPSYWLNPKEI